MKINLFGLFVEELEIIFKQLNLENYKAKQIAEWMYKRGEYDFHNMTNISKKEREMLWEKCIAFMPSSIKCLESQDKLTNKFLLELEDKKAVETVLMRHNYGNSVCVSSQVGCAMGCTFCASTLAGIERNLTGGEIFGQVLFINRILQLEDSHVSNIVVMGSGEPLANFNNVIRFLKLCHETYSLNLSYRSMTVSTSGLVPQIYKLADLGMPITLSISLHAPNNEIRSALMPINSKYPIDLLIAAGDYYFEKTGRRVTYEYILIDGINDQLVHARQLAALLQHKGVNVNLIPINPVLERGYARPKPMAIKRFLSVLSEKRINVTLRKEMGKDIAAACGQLRHQVLSGEF